MADALAGRLRACSGASTASEECPPVVVILTCYDETLAGETGEFMQVIEVLVGQCRCEYSG